MLIEDDEDIRAILESVNNIAVIGASPYPGAKNFVPAFLQEMGYRMIPVNPEHDEIMGEKCYASLKDIPEQIDMVDCFRPSEDILAIAEEAIAIGAKVLWTQLGIYNEEAAQKACRAGLKVVMDHCPHIEIPRLFGRHSPKYKLPAQ